MATIHFKQNATGTADGSTAANAISVATLNARTNSPGDILIWNGTLTTPVIVSQSGTSGNPITYKAAADGSFSKAAWGIDTASAFYASGKDYIVIDGNLTGIIECTANGDQLATDQAARGVTLNNCDNCEVKNLRIRTMYVHTTNTSNTVGLGLYHTRGIFTQNCDSFSAHHNTISDCYTGIHDIANGAAVLGHSLYNNTISACSTAIFGPCLSGGSDSFNGINIFNNDLTMGGNWDDPAGDNHIDGIHGFGVTSNTNRVDNLKVYNNYIHGNPSTRCTAFIFMEYGIYGALVYNNVCIGLTNRPNEGYIHMKFQAAQGTIVTSVYNNTIVGLGNGATGGNGINITQSASLTTNIYNNSISACFTGIYTGAVKAGTWNIDNNIYFNCGYPGWLASGSTTLAAWRTAIGGDAASVTSTPNAAAPYYIPVATSAAIGTGADLSAFFTTDISGATITSWGIGAVLSTTTSWTTGAGGGSDVTAPTPNPATFASVTADTTTQITAVATTASDLGGLHATPYDFAIDGTWQGYQSSPTKIFTGLTPATSYAFKTRTKDAVDNVTSESSTSNVSTLALTPAAARLARKAAVLLCGNSGGGAF